MNYIGLNKFDTTNGDGIRVSLFVSGCRLHCKGCFNQEAWDFNAGKKFTWDTVQEILNALKDDSIAGFSLLGGEPFEPEHEEVLFELLKQIKKHYPNKTIWVWTGNKFYKILKSPLLQYCDVVVAGPYIEGKKVNGRYYGSSNQRVFSRYGNTWGSSIGTQPTVTFDTSKQNQRRTLAIVPSIS